MDVPINILVVDDNQDNIDLLDLALSDLRHRVLKALNGKTALIIAEKEQPDLIILDIHMPEMDGFEVLQRLRQNARTEKIPVILLTAMRKDPQSIESGLALGADEYLTKPIDIQELLVRVKSIMRLKKAEQELERTKADFTAMLVHDLRSPLAGIKGTIECIRDVGTGEVLDQLHHELLDAALTSSEKMLNLINDILDLSKLETGKLHLMKTAVDFPAIVDFACKNLRIPMNNKKLRLEQKYTPTLPKLDIDPDKIGQVMTNFVSNSIKFTPEGGTISISADLEDFVDELDGSTRKQLIVTVADTGAGIAKEELPLLFGKYKQTKTGKMSKYKGTGLGLAISKRIIEAHNGKVWVESELNKGTTFYFTIPVTDSDRSSESPKH
ncbi:MAG: hybrid sensor histidine kinase/response regulator [Bacteroidota bacterium]